MADAIDTVAKKFPDTKFAIIDCSIRRPQGQADERPRPPLQRAGGGLPRRLPRRAASRSARRGASRRSAPSAARRSRRSTTTSPATRPARRRRAGHQDPERATRRTSSTRQVQGDRAEPDRARAPTSSSRSPAAAASARSTRRRRRASGASASTPTRRYLGPHILTSALKKVDVAVFTRSSRPGRHVQGRHGHVFDLEERRRRHRQDQLARCPRLDRRAGCKQDPASRSRRARSRASPTRVK